MSRLKMKPIAENEGLSWDAFCEAIRGPIKPACAQPPILFDEAETQDEQLEEQECAREPPALLYKPEAYVPLSAYGV